MTILFDLFVGIPIGLFILWFLWLCYRIYKTGIVQLEIRNAYFLKKFKIEVEKKQIDFDEMMREYHEAVTIFRKKETNKGIMEEIDEEIEGELEETNGKKGKK